MQVSEPLPQFSISVAARSGSSFISILTLLGLCMALTNTGAAATETGVDRTLVHDGRTREYRLYVPPGLDRTKQVPLVFALHGGGGDAAKEEGRVPYNEFAQRDGWIVVYPNGVERHWNDLRGYEGFISHTENVDDVGMIETILDQLSDEFAIDANRVFVTGGSNGGMMSFTVAAGLADRVAAIAPMVGSMARPVYETFKPSRPVSLLMINDKGDPRVKWEGGPGGRANIVSVPDTLAIWSAFIDCDSSQTTSAEAIPGQVDDARVSHTVWSGCSDKVHMELYVVEANKHGHPKAIIDKKNGRHVHEVIWRFFKRSGR